MSNAARVRRNNASPTTKPQPGPIRATLPVSLMRGSPSPDESRTKARQTSPENAPASPNVKGAEKAKTLSWRSPGAAAPNMRRTASLDAIYLNGQWPRDHHLHTYCGRPMVDKFTQTTSDEGPEVEDRKVPPPCSAKSSSGSEQLDKIRQRLQRSKESSRLSSASGQHHSPVHGDHSAIVHPVSRAIAIPNGNIPKAVIPRMRNSVEGLNQEIEKLVLKGISGNEEEMERSIDEPPPDGHRAPIADLLRHTRHADTQTPSGGGGSQSASPASYSLSPMSAGDATWNSSHCQDVAAASSSSPGRGRCCCYHDDCKSASPEPGDAQFGTSPSINNFLAREPPDGCERVKIVEESRKSQPASVDPLTSCCPPKPTNPVFKPSSSSAFYPPARGLPGHDPGLVLTAAPPATAAVEFS